MRPVLVSEVIANSKFNNFFVYIFVVCWLTVINEGFNINVFGLVIPSLIKEWGLTPAQLGALGSFGMAGMIFGSLVFGPLADKLGKSKALMLATGLYCVFTIGVGFSDGFNEFALFRFIAGIGLAGAFPIVVAFTSEYSPKAIRSRLVVWVTSGMALGTVVAVLISLALLNTYGWRIMFYVTAVPLLLLVAQFFLPESMSFLISKGEKEKIAKTLEAANSEFKAQPDDEYQLAASEKGAISLASLFGPGMAKNTILFWAIFFLNYIFIYGVLTWLTQLMKMQGWSLEWSLGFTMIWNLGFVLGIPLCGWLQDKYGGRIVLTIGLFVLAILTYIDSQVGASKDAMTLGIALFLSGAAQHGLNGVCGSYMTQNYPLAFRGLGTGWGYGIGRIGGTIGPMVGGLLLTFGISGPNALMIFAVIPIITAILVFLTTDQTRVSLSEQGKITKS
jgi:AAHS family benzoate transporter-like MFS transporter